MGLFDTVNNKQIPDDADDEYLKAMSGGMTQVDPNSLSSSATSPALSGVLNASPQLGDDQKQALTDAYNNQFNNPVNDLNTQLTGKLAPTSPLPDDSDDSADQDDQSPAGKLAAMLGNQRKPSAKADTSGLPTLPAQQSSISDTIKKLLGGGDDDLKAAQAQTDSNRQRAQLGMAANMIGAALGGPKGKLMDDVYKNQLENADSPIKNVKDAQALKQQKLQQADLQTKLEDEMKKSDPNSDISTYYRGIANKYGFQAPEGTSASTLEKVLPNIEKYAQLKENQKLRQAMVQQANDKKTTDKQNSYMGQTISTLESARGNAAVQQAQKDFYSAQKAESLANLYGDPNKLSPQQVQLLASEVAKIAQGGVPSMHELDGLNPKTIPSGLAKMAQAVSNNPEPAQAGAFVKQYLDYTGALKKDAQSVIKDKFGRVIESNKGRIGDDNYDTLQDRYMKPFLDQQKATEHPQDDEAVAWAKKNPSDPRAAKILQANGQ